MPILKSNPKGEATDIFAPQYLHNPSIGETVSLNYFGYPSDTEQYSAVASYSTKIQRDIDLNYKNVAAGGGRYILAAQATWFKNAFRRFFGIGNQAPESHETNYTSRETLIQLTAGINRFGIVGKVFNRCVVDAVLRLERKSVLVSTWIVRVNFLAFVGI